MTKRALSRIAAAIAVGLLSGVAASLVPAALAQGLPSGKGKELVESACTDCHDLSRITDAGFSREEWGMLVQSMVFMGANLKREDIAVVADYLAASFPPKTKQ